MSNDDRLDRFLADQANLISLPPADPAGVARRGARRRTRRRGAVIASVVALGLLATSVAVVDRDGNDDAKVSNSDVADATPSTYDWTVVDPTSGLGYSDSSALLDDGSIYSLSTAPGQAGDGPVEPGHLYRSTDGTEWDEVALPVELRPSSIAGSGSSLYALGTIPASNGGRDLVLATSGDGAATWQELELPDDVSQLDARFPEEIFIGQPSVAALDADHLVAAVTVQAVPQVDALLPVEERGRSYTYDPEGVTVYEDVEGDDCPDVQRDAAASTTSTVSAEVCSSPRATTPGEEEARTLGVAGSGEEAPVQATYTWAELGLAPELEALLAGRTFVYSTQDGEHFEAATLPEGIVGTSAQAVATSAGYTVFVADWSEVASSTSVLTSADGITFSSAPGSPLPGGLGDVGVLGDQPAVAVYAADGSTTLRLRQADGGWTELPLSDGGDFSGQVAFGPLGLAAVVYGETGGPETPAARLVHTTDGTHLSTVSLDDELGAPAANVLSLSVTADAIFVRIGGPVDADPGTPPVQRVLVGTPV